jgi:hypothetical protein
MMGAMSSVNDSEPTPHGPVLLLAVLAKLAVIVAAAWAATAQPSDSPYLAPREGDANAVVWYLARGFDANMYQRLALEGYYDDFSKGFPLGYPLLVRGAHSLVGNAQTAAVLVSNACAVGAVLVFTALAAAYARGAGRRGAGVVAAGSLTDDSTTGSTSRAAFHAGVVFALTPGVLAFGTVAYSESAFLLFAVGAWLAYVAADGPDADAPRSLPLLALASLLGGASVMVRHLGATLFLCWAVFEAMRLVRSRTRGRSLAEAAALGWAGVPVAAWFLWKFSAHDMAAIQERVWDMRFVFLGAPASLLAGSATRAPLSPEYVLMIYMSAPLVLWLGWRVLRLDPRLGLLTALGLVLALSYTGAAAQSFNRYAWSLWPLALGALRLRDRGAVWAIAGWLLLLSAWCLIGHVQGSAAL